MKQNIIYGISFGISALFIFVIGLLITKATWQTTNPGTVADANLYVNGNGTLTKDKWNNLVDKTVAINMPAGAVVGFNLASCPSGWSAFTQATGRVIVGVGNGTDSNYTNRTFTLLQSGGEYTHKLIVSEMPAHSHQYVRWSTGWPDGNSFGASTGFKGVNSATDSVGGDQYHNNLQPYVALLYCVKN